MPKTSQPMKVQSQIPLCAQPWLASDYIQQQSKHKAQHGCQTKLTTDSLCATLSSSKRIKVYFGFSFRWIRSELCVCFRHSLHLVICLKLAKMQRKLDVQNLLGMEKHLKSSKGYYVVENIPRETVKAAIEQRS